MEELLASPLLPQLTAPSVSCPTTAIFTRMFGTLIFILFFETPWIPLQGCAGKISNFGVLNAALRFILAPFVTEFSWSILKVVMFEAYLS
jgi:hypothetical protein